MNAFLQYIKDSYTELHEKVTWPTWPEAQRDTWVVAVATIILAGIVALVDMFFSAQFRESLNYSTNVLIKMAEMLKKWYVVRAISGQENKVKNYIEQEVARLGMSDYLDGVMVPMEKFFSVSGGKKVSKERPFFPGYVMIEANLDGEMLHIIKGIPGVVGFLSDRPGGDPVPLRKSEVNRMLGKVDEMAEMPEAVIIPFASGEPVKVIDGRSTGLKARWKKSIPKSANSRSKSRYSAARPRWS